MDIKFNNQNQDISDEYRFDQIEIAIKRLIIPQTSYLTLKNNFNGFINLYKDWRIKAIKQLIKNEEKETYGKYFESFIYNWIAFNACYSFYRENLSDGEDSKDKNNKDEGKSISELGDANINHIKDKIMRLYSHNLFKELIGLKIDSRNLEIPHEITNIYYDLLNTTKTHQEYIIDNVAVTKKIYFYVTYRLKRVRNNLFHGKKSDDNLGDQKIVKAAAKLLNYFLYLFEIDFLTTIKVE
jgi:hypothetical protein